MDLDSNKVSAFYLLAKEGSFQAASKLLGISQPALSQKIARLEDELEQTLLIRKPKELILTNAGRELVRYYKSKIDLDNSFFESISGRNSVKELRIGAYSSISNSVLIPLLAKLKEEVVLSVTTKELYDLESALISGEVDFILTTMPISRQNVICELVAKEKQVHVVPTKSLEQLPFLDHDEEDQTTFKFLKSRKLATDITRSFFGDVNGVIKAVECGLGQAVVSEHLVLKNKKLKVLKASGSIKENIYLCYYNKVYYPEVQKRFIQSVKNNLSLFL